uniref:Uncharacterized protein n=1 Tax=Eutreptiella gymnastica TaxID=73025 RepID=A0A6U7U6C0_9EUGL|mmetsp:Transcript_120536/g.209843  ORF Transcript_120536/g.209843 Transcript_120536/m.209843 type:complete len:130 (+) Transcript_120536:318-707(+)
MRCVGLHTMLQAYTSSDTALLSWSGVGSYTPAVKVSFMVNGTWSLLKDFISHRAVAPGETVPVTYALAARPTQIKVETVVSDAYGISRLRIDAFGCETTIAQKADSGIVVQNKEGSEPSVVFSIPPAAC